MSRSSAIVIPLLVAAWISPALAQDRAKVIETVRNLESRLEQMDKFIRGLQSTAVEEKQEEGIAAQAEAIATAASDFAQQLQATEEALGVAEQDAATARLQLQEMTQHAGDVEAELAAAVLERESGRDVNTRLTQKLDDAAGAGEAMAREMQALEQRAEDAEAELAVERDQLGELEEELRLLRESVSSQNPDAPNPSGIIWVPGVEGGFQIHITGGEVTFHISGLDQPQVPTRTEDLPGDSNLHLRLPSIGDDAVEENASSGGADSRPTLRIH